MYIIEKEKGVYQIFNNNRIHIGSTRVYAEIRHIIDNYYMTMNKKNKIY